MIDDFRLRVFYTAALAKNFTRAARKLNITQPAVSLNIAELEQTVGDTLFIRETGKPLVLTEKGMSLFGYAERILSLYERLNRELVPSSAVRQQEGVELRIAAVKLAAGFLLPQAIKMYSAAYPLVSVTLVERTDDEIFGLLSEEKVDIGITSRPADNDNEDETELISRPFAELSMNHGPRPVLSLYCTTKKADGITPKSSAIRNFVLTCITQ